MKKLFYTCALLFSLHSVMAKEVVVTPNIMADLRGEKQIAEFLIGLEEADEVVLQKFSLRDYMRFIEILQSADDFEGIRSLRIKGQSPFVIGGIIQRNGLDMQGKRHSFKNPFFDELPDFEQLLQDAEQQYAQNPEAPFSEELMRILMYYAGGHISEKYFMPIFLKLNNRAFVDKIGAIVEEYKKRFALEKEMQENSDSQRKVKDVVIEALAEQNLQNNPSIDRETARYRAAQFFKENRSERAYFDQILVMDAYKGIQDADYLYGLFLSVFEKRARFRAIKAELNTLPEGVLGLNLFSVDKEMLDGQQSFYAQRILDAFVRAVQTALNHNQDPNQAEMVIYAHWADHNMNASRILDRMSMNEFLNSLTPQTKKAFVALATYLIKGPQKMRQKTPEEKALAALQDIHFAHLGSFLAEDQAPGYFSQIESAFLEPGNAKTVEEIAREKLEDDSIDPEVLKALQEWAVAARQKNPAQSAGLQDDYDALYQNCYNALADDKFNQTAHLIDDPQKLEYARTLRYLMQFFPKLAALSLENVSLGGEAFLVLERLALHLKSLSLNNCGLFDADIHDLASLGWPSLTQLNFDQKEPVKRFSVWQAKLPQLQWLNGDKIVKKRPLLEGKENHQRVKKMPSSPQKKPQPPRVFVQRQASQMIF